MSLIHLLCWLLSARLSLQEIINIAKPGCPTKCGNLTVPYPFGIGSNCSMNPWFDIDCDASVDPPNMLVSSRNEFRLIDISESQIRIKNHFVTRLCGNKSMNTNFTLNFSETPYTFSDAHKLTHVGCSDLAVLEGLSHRYVAPNLSLNNFAGGCVSFCSDDYQFPSGSSPEDGWCQIPIPKGTVFLKSFISDLEDRWGNVKTKACSYSFIGGKDNFTFQAVSGISEGAVVLDWWIGTENCSHARNSADFGCHANSVCIDADGGVGGYSCSCFIGYQGNPYLPPGCFDINECIDNNPCHSLAICINTPGSFICACQKGYHGDGRRNGVGCLIAGMGLLTLCSVSFGLKKFVRKRNLKNRRKKFFKQNGGLLLQQQTSIQEGQTILGNTRIFNAKELEIATDRFNESRILGRGGQGTVYKGMLSDGQIIAIKKSQLVDEHKSKYLVEQFINEVVILSQINHRNVVKLLGCCLETEVPLLVYEFVPNGTLFRHIHDDNDSHEFPFSWRMRLKIAAEVAGALAYLHSATSLPIFHRDIKSSNILLDEKYVAKVSDFGTSKSLAIGQTHLTTLVKGTFGYIDPEYFQSSQFTEKSDVYSLGVVLVELLTGLKPIMPSTSEEDAKSLVFRFLSSVNEDNLDSILDDQVATEGEREGIVSVAKLARRCLNLNGKKRPNMKEVAMELENIRMAQMGSIVDTRLQEDSKILSKDDYDYGWTSTTDFGTTTTSSCDAHPLMFDTI
ncbi:Serine/threonine protein kinase [Handroanthus impetiginosus]|uniref:Serine/threonine protein kinase n=1 Tax=Handroanthus impetiginosus TaxID=429701 RepID=A0A2G9HTW8_9LAMI|nr:Serine/threonine protein kinase [Handroanthus impetiginosus]